MDSSFATDRNRRHNVFKSFMGGFGNGRLGGGIRHPAEYSARQVRSLASRWADYNEGSAGWHRYIFHSRWLLASESEPVMVTGLLMKTFLNIAAYKFAALSNLGPLRDQLLTHCRDWQLRGTILLSPEGVNLFVAGEADSIERLLGALRAVPGLETLEPKRSESDHQPFSRMLVRLKKEIIAFGVEGISPIHRTSPKLPARTLKEWLDKGLPVTLLDTRNDYEVKLGTFKNAVPMGIARFRQFPDAVRRLPPKLKTQPIVMFCTGGIRCEKAAPFMEREGFEQIYQLDGGILKYFEECGGAHYNGECFVFDQRVGVDPLLQETDAGQCFACLTPLTGEEQADPRYVAGESCPHCYQTAEQRAAAAIAQRHGALRKAADPLPGSMPYDNFRPIHIPGECDGLPLVKALVRIVHHMTPGDWATQSAAGLLLNSERVPAQLDRVVRNGERFFHKFPAVVEPDVNAAIEILHEDEALVVINKPAPLPMHAAGRFHRNTLQHLLNTVYHPEKLKQAHRLDANTTGVVLFTRTRRFASLLQPQFAAGTVEKRYLVRVTGDPAWEEYDCDLPISAGPGALGSREIDEESGLPSRTHFQVLQRLDDDTTLLEARPRTGRTNQIRIHLWHLGYPVCGDQVYLAGGRVGDTQTLALSDPPLCLHAWEIRFTHPLTQRPVTFTAPVPAWASCAFTDGDGTAGT